MRPMTALDDLPPYRRAKLLWRWAHQGVRSVEQRVRYADGEPCGLPTPPPGPSGRTVAVLGDDGLHHLSRGGQMLCCTGKTNEDAWVHQQPCGWLDLGNGPQDWQWSVDEPAVATRHVLSVKWHVRPAGPDVDPGTIARRDRCRAGDYMVAHSWPPPPARTPSIRRMRAALVEALGPDCHLCGRYAGAMVDHDHETGFVRGLLCAMCNCTLEECPHLGGCPRADYMASPPAAALSLVYPLKDEWRPKESTRRRKIEQLGFDPFEGVRTRRTPG